MNVRSSRVGIPLCRIFLACILLFCFCSASAAQDQAQVYLPTMYEELYGTWIYAQGDGKSLYGLQKVVISNWGFTELYYTADVDRPFDIATQIILEKRTDAEGYIWYKTWERMQTFSRTGYLYMYKLSPDRNSFEITSTKFNGPYSIPYFTESAMNFKNSTRVFKRL